MGEIIHSTSELVEAEVRFLAESIRQKVHDLERTKELHRKAHQRLQQLMGERALTSNEE